MTPEELAAIRADLENTMIPENGWVKTSRALLAHIDAITEDHVPSGYEDMVGYGQVSCSCGWMSDVDKTSWSEHLRGTPQR